MKDLEAENKALREHIKVLTEHIHSGINCGFFCALPECAKYLSGAEEDDQNSVAASRGQAVERASCSTRNQQGQRS